MTKKKNTVGDTNSSKTNLGKNNRDVVFVDFDLTREQNEDLEGMVLNAEITEGQIFEFINDETKVGLRYDAYWNCFAASVSSNRNGTTYVITGRGSSPDDAAISLVYRWAVVVQYDWDTAIEMSQRRLGSRFG